MSARGCASGPADGYMMQAEQSKAGQESWGLGALSGPYRPAQRAKAGGVYGLAMGRRIAAEG